MMVSARDIGDRDAPPDDGAAAHAHGSFFGRRKGHKLRIHQADLIDNLLPHLALDIAAPAPALLADLFDGEIGDVRLEIGFGGGEHLIAEAQAFPNIGFIGCEPYVNGMAKILTQIEALNISNIRLYAGDAAELLAWAPPRSLVRIDLIHPDPWPKRRHWKRRFVQDATVNAIAHPERRRRIPFRQRHRRLLRLDAGASDAQLRFSLDRRARRRLATTVGRLHDDALRPQSRTRGTGGCVFKVSAGGIADGHP
jgi:tRNA (guanine-N7-)-methyltransferase